jgi:hypothetical protein
MYKVKVENPCRCFFKSGLSEVLDFENQEDAKKEAEYMLNIMKTTFCNKHSFSLSEQFGEFTIFVKENR